MSTKPSVWAGSVRETLITASRDAWKKRLIDLSRRNNLLYYRPLVNGTVELPFSPDLAEFLVSGRSRILSELSGDKELSAANVRTIVRKGLENLEEKGLSDPFPGTGALFLDGRGRRARCLRAHPALPRHAKAQRPRHRRNGDRGRRRA